MRHFFYIWPISLGGLGLILAGLLLGAGNVTGATADSPVAAPLAGLFTPTPTATATRIPAVCTAITGSITNSDPTQAGGLNPNGPASTCSSGAGCPGLVDTQPRHYDRYHFINLTSLYQCITIQLDAPACSGPNAVISAAYLTFDPANICASYGAGTASSPSGSYSFYIPCCGRGSFDLVVAEANPGAGCSSYTVTVLSDITCPTGPTPTPTITNTPTPTHTPTATPTCITSVLDWRIVPAESPGNGTVALNGVAALAADDAWTVGSYQENSLQRSLVEHWDGQSWTVVPSPNSGFGDNHLSAIAVVARTISGQWAAMIAPAGSGDADRTLGWGCLEHRAQPVHRQRHAQRAGGAGRRQHLGRRRFRRPDAGPALGRHRLTAVPTPDIGTVGNALLGIVAVAANDIWAVGRYDDRGGTFYYQTLVQHWDGTAWNIVPSPNPQFGGDLLYGVQRWRRPISGRSGSGNGPGPSPSTGTARPGALSPAPTTAPSRHYLYNVAATEQCDSWAVGSARQQFGPQPAPCSTWNGSAGAWPPAPTSARARMCSMAWLRGGNRYLGGGQRQRQRPNLTPPGRAASPHPRPPEPGPSWFPTSHAHPARVQPDSPPYSLTPVATATPCTVTFAECRWTALLRLRALPGLPGHRRRLPLRQPR